MAIRLRPLLACALVLGVLTGGGLGGATAEAGGRAFIVGADLIRTVRETPGGHGAGVVYWHPEGIRLRDDAGHAQDADAMSLFADDGEALPAVRVLDRPEPPGH